MGQQNLALALTSGSSGAYIEHLKEHRKRVLLCYDKVKAKAKADPAGGAAKRLAEYDVTLGRYNKELEAWAKLSEATDGEG